MEEFDHIAQFKILEELDDLFAFIGDAPKERFNIDHFSTSVTPALRWLQQHQPSLSSKLPIWIRCLDTISTNYKELFNNRQNRVYDGHGSSGSTVSVSRYPIYSALLLDDTDLHQGLFVLRALLITALIKGEHSWSTRNNPGKKSNAQLIGKLIRFSMVRSMGDDALKTAKGEAVAEILRRINELTPCDPKSLQTLFKSDFKNDLNSFADYLNQKQKDDFSADISKMFILIDQILAVFREVSASKIKVKNPVYRQSAQIQERSRRFTMPPTENQNLVNNEGIMNEDAFPTSTIIDICLDELPIRQLTYAREKARAYHSELATVINNQYLPDIWGSLTSVEIKAVFDLIDGLAKTNQLAALVADLVICTATFADMLPSIHLYSNKTDLQAAHSNNFIDVDQGVWIHRVNMPESAYSPKPEETEFLRDVGDWISLKLPDRPASLIKSLCQSGWESLDELFVAHQHDPKELITLIVEPLRERFGTHITAGRMAEVLLHQLHFHTSDPVISLFIVGDAYRQIPMQSYYTCVSGERLRSVYYAVLINMGYATSLYTDASKAWVGSKLAPSDEALKGYIEFIRNQAQTKLHCVKDLTTLADAHNAYVFYTIKMLQFSTGHRDVADPFERLACFLLDEDNALIVTDKVSQIGLEGRLTWLPDESIEQINQYIKHLRGLSQRLGRWHARSPLRGAIKSILNPFGDPPMPLMFFMQPECDDWESVTPTSMKKYEIVYWNLPGNVGRHVLISALCQEGCPQEYRAYQVGHADRGEQLSANVSLVSPRDVRDLIVPKLNTIIKSQGWQAIRGFRDSNANRLNHLNSLEARLFGAKSREIVRVAHSRTRRQIVRGTVARIWPVSQEQTSPLPSPSQKVVEQIESELSSSGERLAASLVNIFRRWLRVMARRHNWQGKWGRGSLHDTSQTKPSPFSYANASNIQKIRYLRNALRWYLFHRSDENIYVLQSEDLCLSFFASALLYDGMIDQRYLSDDLLQIVIDRAVRFKHLVWVDLEPEDLPLRRWILHPNSAGLLGHILERKIKQGSVGKIRQKIPTFLQSISNLYVASGKSHNSIGTFSFKQLLGWLQVEAYTTLPGAVAGFAAGDVNSTSLNLTAWIRLITGHRLATLNSQNLNSTVIPINQSKLNIRLQKKVTEPVTEEEFRSFQKILSLASKEPTSRGSRQVIKSGLQQVVQHGKSANVLNLLASWGLQLLNKTRKLKGSTIIDYLRANLKPLVAECADCSLMELDDFDIEDLYERVLAYTTKENRADNASRLRDFHQFLAQVFGANDVDFHEIEPLIGKKSYKADANIVTPSEAELLIHSLEKNEANLPTYEGQRLALCTAFFEDTGVRASEPFVIRGLDVQVPRIRLRATTFGNLKTGNARRAITLSDNVQTKLQDWMLKKTTFPGYSANEQCFVSMDKNAQKMPKWVVEALKQASGDATISLRNFRHASLTFSMLAIAGCHQPESWGIDKGYLLRRSRAFGALNILWPSRRMSYWVALQHGHGHPSTSFSNYVHALDVILFERATSNFELSSSEALLLFSLKSDVSVRQLISRAKRSNKNTNPLNIFGKNGNVDLIEKVSNIVSIKKRYNDLKFNSPTDQACISLSLIHDILKIAGSGHEVIQIADIMNLPNDLTNKLIVFSKDLSRVTKYNPYGFSDLNNSSFNADCGAEVIRAGEKTSMDRYIKDPLLKNISDLIVGNCRYPEWFLSGINLWRKGIRVREKGVYLSNQKEVKEYVIFLDRIGVDRSLITALLSKNLRSKVDYKNDLHEWMVEVGIVRTEHIDRSVEINDTSSYKVTPIGVGAKNSSHNTQKVINFLSYLSLCALQLRVGL